MKYCRLLLPVVMYLALVWMVGHKFHDPGPPPPPHFSALYSGNYECFVFDGKHFYADKFMIFAIDPSDGSPPMAFSTWVCG